MTLTKTQLKELENEDKEYYNQFIEETQHEIEHEYPLQESMIVNLYTRGVNSADLVQVQSDGESVFIEGTMELAIRGLNPLSREIDGGGLEGAYYKFPGISLSSLLSREDYPLEKIVESYANMEILTKRPQENFDIKYFFGLKEINVESLTFFQTIRLIKEVPIALCKYSRLIQLGVKPDEMLNVSVFEKIIQQAIVVYKLLDIYGTKISASSDLKVDKNQALELDKDLILSLIEGNLIDELRIAEGEKLKELVIELNNRLKIDYFSVSSGCHPESEDLVKWYIFSHLFPCGTNYIGRFLSFTQELDKYKILPPNELAEAMGDTAESFKDIVGNYENTIHIANLLQNAFLTLSTTPDQFLINFDQVNKYIVDNFPVIYLISPYCEGIKRVVDEFRSDKPLVFGKDILLIATDTGNNIEKLYNWLSSKGLETSVGIVTIDQLTYFTEHYEDYIFHNNSPHKDEDFILPRPIVFDNEGRFNLPQESDFITLKELRGLFPGAKLEYGDFFEKGGNVVHLSGSDYMQLEEAKKSLEYYQDVLCYFLSQEAAMKVLSNEGSTEVLSSNGNITFIDTDGDILEISADGAMQLLGGH